MKLLGLMMVRNGADRVTRALDGMQGFCDEVYVIDDRSTDQTLPLLLQHPVVKNVFHVDPAISHQDWFFPESMGLNLLYRMADFSLPDWVIFLDDDQAVESPKELRPILSGVPSSVAALLTPMVSSWADPDYPLLVPLMGRATTVRGHIWRYSPGLESGSKPLHNGRLPVNIERRHQALRVPGEKSGLMLPAPLLHQMHADLLDLDAFEIERDAHPIGGGRAEIAIELHCSVSDLSPKASSSAATALSRRRPSLSPSRFRSFFS